MSRSTQQMRDIAERLVALESPQGRASGTGVPAAFQVCEKLRPQLAPLMGARGFHALLSRALIRAQVEVPRLNSVQVNVDGALIRLDESGEPLKPEDGCTVVAQLLSLLNALVGERLTLQIVSAAWPTFPLADTQSVQPRSK